MVGEEFDLGRHFACVVVVDDGVDDGFAHGFLVPQRRVDALQGGLARPHGVFHLQSFDHALCGGDERGHAVFVVGDKFHAVAPRILRNLD